MNFLIEQSDICRCCLSYIGGVDLEKPYGVLMEALSTILLKYFNITLALQPGYSYTICEECAKKIENIFKFHEQVKSSERKYNELWQLYNNRTVRNDFDENSHRDIENGNTEDLDEDIPISKLQNFLPVQTPKSCKQLSERKRIILTCEIVLKETTACPFRHLKSWFRCFFCLKDFMELNLLREHTNETHTNIDNELKMIKRFPRSLQIDTSNLECRKCHLNLTDVDSMRRHLSDVHNKVIYSEFIADYKVNSSPYTCHLCEKKFHVFRSLTTHLNEHYANCICDVCGKSFMNTKRLKVHKRTHDNGSYPCLKCGKVLKTQTSKANHMEMHSKRIIKCHICEKQMKHYNDRIKHMSEVHNITHNFVCPFCSRVYNIKHYLATHIRQTHGNKNKKCTECNMAFITNHSLKKHMLKHSRERPYTCNVCSKAYTRKYTLKEHMKDHEKLGKFNK
ncbi:zinc finger protein 699-like [Pieris brassicae]|uniref:zinc finger protein 699-like n=1 Tax=Pieris brassicae TaxID=7116 RepID=UPI001E65E4C3|nr:zinc finger protein 699-like [Pieris brassicae]